MARGNTTQAVGSEEELINCLEDKKVYVKFIPRLKGNNTDNPKHVAYGGMLDTAFKELMRGCDRNGRPKNILTEDEKNFLEYSLGLKENELSVYNRDYWSKHKVRLRKYNNMLDLNDPKQYLDYKILLSNTQLIAKSKDDINKRRTYLYYLETEGDENRRLESALTSRMSAYKLFGKYDKDYDILRFILTQLGKATVRTIKIEDLRIKVGEQIEANPSKVLNIMEDKLLKIKTLLVKAVEVGVIYKRANEYYYKDGKKISEDSTSSRLDDCARYLSQPKNQEKKLQIEGMLK